MRQPYGIVIAGVIGLAAVAAPIFISVQLAWKEALADESSLTLAYAEDALRRTNEMAQQMAGAINTLTQGKAQSCSSSDIAVMRQIDVASSYIQAVGRIEGDDLICTSLGTREPIPLGRPTLITASGAAERLNIRLPIAGNHPLDVFSMRGIAFLLDPTLPLDIPTEGPSISMAIFVPSSPNHAIIAARAANLRAEWFRTIPKGGRITFRSSGYVVAIVRSADTDVAVVTAAPESYVQKHTLHFALIFIPIGLVCACLLGWAIMHISRIRFSLPSVLRSAAKQKEFFVEYQPIVDLGSRRWIGAEAMVRWRRSDGRVIPPDNFIPAAEESGVITSITRCVAEIITADLPGVLQADPDFFVALNLSAPDLLSSETVELLAEVIDRSGARPANVKVEATERGFLQGDDARPPGRHSRSGDRSRHRRFWHRLFQPCMHPEPGA